MEDYAIFGFLVLLFILLITSFTSGYFKDSRSFYEYSNRTSDNKRRRRELKYFS